MSGLAAIWCAARSRRQTRSATSLTPPTAATNLNTNLLAAGDPLAEVQREAEHGLAFAQKARFGFVIDVIATQLGLIRTLRGLTPTFGSFDDEQFDERRIERRFSENPDLAFAECWYWIRKLQARFFAGDYAAAIEASSRAQRLLVDIAVICSKRRNITSTARCPTPHPAIPRPPASGSSISTLSPPTTEQLQLWAANCPENFENRAALVGAEIARIEGRELDAERLYEQAIRSARANGFIHNEALANELAARFYAARGFEKIAHVYLRNARYGYLRWGADGKVRQLDELYPHLRQEEPAPASDEHDRGAGRAPRPRDRDQGVAGRLGRDRAGKAARHAHAHRDRAGGRRARPVDPVPWRRATDRGGSHDQRRHGRRASARRARDRGRAAGIGPPLCPAHPGERDPRRCRGRAAVFRRSLHPSAPARSILCLPLLNQAKLIGVLYLENNLTPRVFAPARIAVLKLLASQAAISLENTRLYRDLENAKRRSAAWSTPTSSGSSSGTSKVGSSRPMTRFSAWWDTTARISSRAACAGRI